ncbi:MarC family protein [Methylomarinum vadi]|uniref:MarC family protein n=1 Tax=Methylomarinum vadi TaxID=438855 RepID=UPI001F3F5565|nr:MarC family protein [Methylomarinum vadi]
MAGVFSNAASTVMLETITVALATFFATIGPIDVAIVFAALTSQMNSRFRLLMALRATSLAWGILTLFFLIGEPLLRSFGISLAALRTAGGILLLLIAIDMVFARSSGATSTTDQETQEAVTRKDISVFPLATPLIAGPGTIGSVILLTANTEGVYLQQLAVYGALLAILAFTFFCLITAGQIHKLLGLTGMFVISRVFGVLLSGLAVQFIFDGIKESGLLSTIK